MTSNTEIFNHDTYVFSPTEYMDGKGRRIVHRRVVYGEKPKDFDEFIGLNGLLVRMPEGDQTIPYRFAIHIVLENGLTEPVVSLHDAFRYWDACAREEGERMRVKVEHNIAQQRAAHEQPLKHEADRLVVANPGDIHRLIKPSGG